MSTSTTQDLIEHINLAYRNGQFAVMERLSRRLIERESDQLAGWTALGLALQGLARHDEAIAALERCLSIGPDHADVLINLGISLFSIGRLDQAENRYREALALEGQNSLACYNLGVLYQHKADHDAAIAWFEAALQRQPDFAEAHCNLSASLLAVGRPGDALLSGRRALAARPDYAQAHFNLGLAAEALGDISGAEQAYRDAVACQQSYPEALTNLGNLLARQGRLTEAHACYLRAVRQQPELAGNHCNLGNLCKEMGLLAQAADCYRTALKLQPDLFDAFSNLILLSSYDPASTPGKRLDLARQFGQQVAGARSFRFSDWRADSGTGRLRVGFLSGDFRQHPVGFFLQALFAAIEPSRIELFAYPTVSLEDELTRALRSVCCGWRGVTGMTDAEASRAIHDDGLHILVDLAGHTANNRLPVLAYKPAPVQATWLGYFGTTGLAEVDYLLGDPQVIPEAEECHFIEQIWRLPESYLCFTPPPDELPVAELPAIRNGHVTFGCFNNLTKVNGAVVALWAELLRHVPGSRLLLKSSQLADPSVQRSTRESFLRQGVDSSRLLLEGGSGRIDYLKAYHRVDIALDPFPFPGGTTSIEGLWMGVPVITLRGDHFIAHNGETIAVNAGLGDWIARDTRDYLSKACEKSADLTRLAALRRGLRRRLLDSPLCDAPRFARHFEDALQGMWQRWLSRQ